MCCPKIIRWVRQWGGDDRGVWVIVRKLDAGWKKAPDFDNDYIPLGNCTRHPFGKWLKDRSHQERARMPHIAFEAFVSFTDGRHRLLGVAITALRQCQCQLRPGEKLRSSEGYSDRLCVPADFLS